MRQITLLMCNEHKTKLKIYAKGRNLYYRCDKFQSKFRNEGDTCCNNMLSIADARYIYNWAELMDEELKEGACGNTKYVEFKVGKIDKREKHILIRRF